jgi:hypothetical protein
LADEKWFSKTIKSKENIFVGEAGRPAVIQGLAAVA